MILFQKRERERERSTEKIRERERERERKKERERESGTYLRKFLALRRSCHLKNDHHHHLKALQQGSEFRFWTLERVHQEREREREREDCLKVSFFPRVQENTHKTTTVPKKKEEEEEDERRRREKNKKEEHPRTQTMSPPQSISISLSSLYLSTG